jgi:hypothetical protein
LGNNQIETMARMNKAMTMAKTDMIENFMVQK